MSNKKQHPQMLRKISLSGEEFSALVCALDFLAHCEDFSYEAQDFNWKDIISAVEKADCEETVYNKSELSASLVAIETSLQSLRTHDRFFHQVSAIFPDLIPDITVATPELQSLLPRFQSYLSDLLHP